MIVWIETKYSDKILVNSPEGFLESWMHEIELEGFVKRKQIKGERKGWKVKEEETSQLLNVWLFIPNWCTILKHMAETVSIILDAFYFQKKMDMDIDSVAIVWT